MGNDFSNSEEEEEFPERFLLVKPCLINLLGGGKSRGQLGAVFPQLALDMLSNTPEEEDNFSRLVNTENLCEVNTPGLFDIHTVALTVIMYII